MAVTNDEWLEALRASGAERDAALDRLRARLLVGLRAATADRGIDPSLLEDAVQDAMIRILDRLDTFRGESAFVTWAMTIAVRGVWTELRRRRWKDVSLDDLLSASPWSEARWVTAEGSEREAERSILVSRVRAAIDADLTEKQRTALLGELAGMPQAEVARRMGSNRNALYKLVHDARKKLRSSLEASGYTTADVRSAFE